VYDGWVKLSEWARREGVHYQSAWEWATGGKMPVPACQAPCGSWMVRVGPARSEGRVVAYCRVSSFDQEPDLERQAGRVVAGATARGLTVAGVVTGVGSGHGGRRRKLHHLLSDPSVTVIVVEHRERLARFGAPHLEAAMSASARRIVVLDPEESTGDLVRDIIETFVQQWANP
jgi:putative resolvase